MALLYCHNSQKNRIDITCTEDQSAMAKKNLKTSLGFRKIPSTNEWTYKGSEAELLALNSDLLTFKKKEDVGSVSNVSNVTEEKVDSPPEILHTFKEIKSLHLDHSKDTKKSMNSPASRHILLKKDSPKYESKYNSDKINFYKSLGRKYIDDDLSDSSSDSSDDSSDDHFPSPPKHSYNNRRKH